MREIDNEEAFSMQMPCQCRCGKWFDLNDGYPTTQESSYGLGKEVVCKECHYVEEEIEEAEDEIEYLENSEGSHKRKIKALKKKVEELKNKL